MGRTGLAGGQSGLAQNSPPTVSEPSECDAPLRGMHATQCSRRWLRNNCNQIDTFQTSGENRRCLVFSHSRGSDGDQAVIHCRPTLQYEFRDLPPATECESRLSEILSASIVQAVMRADGVDPGE